MVVVIVSLRDRVGDRSGHVSHQGRGRRRRWRRVVAGRGVDSDQGVLRRCSRARSRGTVGQRDRGRQRGIDFRRKSATRRDRSGQPGRDRDGVGPVDGYTARAGNRVAGPSSRGGLRAPARSRRLSCRTHRPRARPVLRRAEDRVAARADRLWADDHDDRRVDAAAVVRCVRDRRCHGGPFAAARTRHR